VIAPGHSTYRRKTCGAVTLVPECTDPKLKGRLGSLARRVQRSSIRPLMPIFAWRAETGACLLRGCGLRVSDRNERRVVSARARVERATERGEQLRERLRQLRAGEPSGEDEVQGARLAAVAAADSALRQHERAREAHLSAARLHERAAKAFDHAGQADSARRHREYARADAVAAVLDDQAAREGGDPARS
jgi:hypothetical protein